MFFRFFILSRTFSIPLAVVRGLVLGIVVLVLFNWGTLPAFAQDPQPAAEKKSGAPSGKDKNKLPEPEELLLPTRDGVNLTATYYPSAKGKEAVPVVLLHMWQHNSADFKDLAPYLQQQGHAVLAPDLRGHGGSTRQQYGQKERILNAATLSTTDFSKMVTEDLLALRNFLWDQNNEGKLNLDKLCLVGAEMGASVALSGAGYDAVGYEHGYHRYGTIQLGQFVKALVLISPKLAFKGLPVKKTVQNPWVRSRISVMILVGGGNPKARKDANRVYKLFEKHHPKPPEDKNERKRLQTLFFFPLDTTLQGAKLFEVKSLNVNRRIGIFLYLRLVQADAARNWPWKERKLPHQ